MFNWRQLLGRERKPLTSPIRYEGQDEPERPLTSLDEADALLARLEPSRRSYAIFTRPDGSYVQCAGGTKRMTVEYRVVEPDGRLRHYVVGLAPVQGQLTQISCTVGPIELDLSQLLKLDHARTVVRAFLETGAIPDSFTATDVTERFAVMP